MAVLKSLTFTTSPQPGANPTLDRRLRVIERLEEQKRLVADPNFQTDHPLIGQERRRKDRS